MCLSPKEDASNYINLVPSSTKPNEVNVDDTSDNLSTGDDMDNYEAGSVIYNIVYKVCTVCSGKIMFFSTNFRNFATSSSL